MPTAPSQRLTSLDALRGFDMFWIIGMEGVAGGLGHASNDPVSQFIATQLSHAEWQGFRFLDLVFPLFVFVSGVSLVFSLSRSVDQFGRAAAFRRLAGRCLLLYLLGLLYYGGISEGLDHVRFVGVLQRIAISGLVAGAAFCFAGRRTRLALLVAILVGYWAFMSFVPVPGGVAGDFAQGPTHNWANWVDLHYLPGRKWDVTHDPEGLLSSIPAIATCLLGVMAGDYLRHSSNTPARRAGVLLVAGAALAAGGWLWGLQFPVIKKLWTSSYVLVAGGYSLMLLGVFYWLIDVRVWRAWATPFVWIGMNAITMYLIDRWFPGMDISKAILGGPIAAACGAYGEVLLYAGVLTLNVLIARFLYRRQIFLKV